MKTKWYCEPTQGGTVLHADHPLTQLRCSVPSRVTSAQFLRLLAGVQEVIDKRVATEQRKAYGKLH